MKSRLTDADRAFGEAMKLTYVEMYRFLYTQPAAFSADPMRVIRDAEGIASYPIPTKRHLQAIRSELEAGVRKFRRQVSRGYWPPDTYGRMVAHLRDKGLIDLSTWHDADAERIKRILERGEIRTRAELRRTTEYCDTIGEGELRRALGELIQSYEGRQRKS